MTAGILLVFVAMAVESFAQICLKVGAEGGPAILVQPWRGIAGRLPVLERGSVWKVLGVAFYLLEIFLWTGVLHLLDVSVAFPMGALCFVGVALLSGIFLGESVGLVRWLGVGCILAGTACMTL